MHPSALPPAEDPRGGHRLPQPWAPSAPLPLPGPPLSGLPGGPGDGGAGERPPPAGRGGSGPRPPACPRGRTAAIPACRPPAGRRLYMRGGAGGTALPWHPQHQHPQPAAMVEAFCATWKLVDSHNFDEYMKALGR